MTLDELMQQEELDVGITVSPQEQEHGYDELSPDEPGLAEPLQEDELLRRVQEGLLYLSEPLSVQAVIEGLMQQDTQVMPTADVQENNETGMISSIYAVMAPEVLQVSLRHNSGQLVYGARFPVGYIELAPVCLHMLSGYHSRLLITILSATEHAMQLLLPYDLISSPCSSHYFQKNQGWNMWNKCCTY